MNTTAQAQSKQVKVSEKGSYGEYLTDGDGMSLYLFLRDAAGQSTCYNECAEEWASLTVNDTGVPAGQWVNPDMLGTVKRKDGSLQVTYNGHPLYYYEDDKKAGDITGQDKKEFGAEWYLVKPSGVKMGDVD
ncbi:MAG TPA: hypothetical protein VJ964_01415 [Balneolaceae bacterium]|nr:hypothetical protein [Balneolaceae bacterium]